MLSEHTGGARWGDNLWTSHASSWPFAHLVVCDDRLILNTMEGGFEFPRGRVTSLTCKSGCFSRMLNLDFGALRIEHAVPGYPSFFQFKTFNVPSLCEALRSAGFATTTDDSPPQMFATIKHSISRLRRFLIAGSVVFLFTLFVEGPWQLYPHPFFTPLDDLPRRLPLAVAVGVTVGLIYAAILKRKL